MNIQTLAELKRALVVGQKIQMTRYNNETPPKRIQGVGIVSKVQTNGVYIERDGKSSWLAFPKASCFSPSYERAGHFEIWDDCKHPITLEYKLIDNDS